MSQLIRGDAMDLVGKVAVVTGGGSGLGAALCRRFAKEGAAGVAVVDLDGDAAGRVAHDIGGIAVQADVGVWEEMRGAVDEATAAYGHLDVMASNAGVGEPSDPFTNDATWDTAWRVHVMSNVYAARAALPGMIDRGRGYFVATASANALQTNPIAMAYGVTKHAQLALTEYLAYTYRSAGIRVSCFCPKGMKTAMPGNSPHADNPVVQLAMAGAVTADEAAAMVVDGMREERFLILTEGWVLDDFRAKAGDYDQWLGALADFHDELLPRTGFPSI
jgi:NAD(P)-dependent dehydrogenase (short-subunit alcohol dehydrogenase family)